MIQSGFEILGREFPKALIETLQMMAISMAVSAVFGLLLGFVLFLTSSPLFFRNRFVNAVSGAVVNVIRLDPLCDTDGILSAPCEGASRNKNRTAGSVRTSFR